MRLPFRLTGLALVLLSSLGIVAVVARRDLRVGDVTPDGTVVPTGRAVAPEGLTTTLSASVLDAAVTPDQAAVVVKTSRDVALLGLASGKVRASAPLPGGASMTGVAVSPDGATVAASNAGSSVVLYHVADGKLELDKTLHLPGALVGGASYPCGLAFVGADRLVVAASRDNSLFDVDIPSGKVARIPVDAAPYGVLVQGHRVFVSCWARQNAEGGPTAPSSGTLVEVDARGIGVGGSVCAVDLDAGKVTARAETPRQPTEFASDGTRLWVACANGDAVLELDPGSLAIDRTIQLEHTPGAAPNSIALDPTASRLLVAFGGLDRIGAWDVQANRWQGFERTAWYPSLVRITGGRLLVGTSKGVGSRSAAGFKHGIGDFTATLSLVDHPAFASLLPKETIDGPPREGIAPAPIPARTGEPSLIKHVVYVIKENRTYDQMLGDMKEGNGDPRLTMYGAEVTPNHHALARDFVLLDNYYCNGIVSADGHAWATEGNATTFYERSRGGWTRSYPFGDDPLATSSTGYIWDDATAHGRSVMNFGEFDYAEPQGGKGALAILRDFEAGLPFTFKQNIGVADLRAMSDPDYPGWNLSIPDILRADRFKRRLRQLEQSGDMADLTIVYLPQDHTSGGSRGFPSPRAQVADNDLGLGRVIDAISHSRFWPQTAIFVEEDDPQDGFDHVDGYRSLCLVVSPYAKRRHTVSHFYNQDAVLHTMERILGLPPMNANDAEAPVMTDCFTAKPDQRPYTALPNRTKLDETPKSSASVSFDLRRPDAVDDDVFNRRLWALSGKPGPYPGR